MGKGPAKHLKRELAPTVWPIHRKKHVWTVRTMPGPHPLRESIPLKIVFREILKLAQNNKEVKMLVKEGKVLVDGKPRKDERFPVGIMDVVEIPEIEQKFRVIPIKGGKLKLQEINEDESNFKLCRVEGKTLVKGGKVQLNLHDGTNILVSEDFENIKVNDVLKMKIPEREILDRIFFQKGVQALITGGRSQGVSGIIVEIGSEPGAKKTVSVETSNGEKVKTLAKYVFPIETTEPLIKSKEARII
ncbi:30S ribosomal protein S4e [Candidatus Bathyarchaeota archaeon]|nr:30S ribosomal protein S4e [Candidatus Bathyarchaeota archaeon]MBS7630757.1 30S ribosomal protein S4e [Candidatus Bathyarchaeota archaeon]